MRFIVDKALSPKVALYFNDNNHEAILVDEFASFPPVDDVVIFEYAIQNNFIVITADVDYRQLLALTKNDRPSVVIFRLDNQLLINVIHKLDFVATGHNIC